MRATVAELEYLASHGFVGVSPPGNVADPSLPPLGDPTFEAFWATCAETGLVLTVHAAFGMPQYGKEQGEMLAMMVEQVGSEELMRMQFTADTSIDQMPEDSPVRAAITAPRRVFWQLMIGDVFDRHPELKLALTEVRADWVPATLELMDRHFASVDHGLSMSPREYWQRHVYVTPSSPRPSEVAMRDVIGADRFMFGMDYPHPEGTWPNSREWIQHAFAGVPEDELRAMLGLNAVECFGLDGNALAPIAERIGPRPEELLGEHEVDARMVEQFHGRSGYQRPPEVVDQAFYERMIVEDEQRAAALR